MPMTVDQFRAKLAETNLFVYERSVDEAQGTVVAMVKKDLTKLCSSKAKAVTLQAVMINSIPFHFSRLEKYVLICPICKICGKIYQSVVNKLLVD